MNANQLFYWRKLYRAGQLGGESPGLRLLPVSVEGDQRSEAESEQSEKVAPAVTMNIEFPGRALVSLEGAVDAMIVRAVLESLPVGSEAAETISSAQAMEIAVRESP